MEPYSTAAHTEHDAPETPTGDRAQVRVLRLLEYEYPDLETAVADMDRWGIPPNGTNPARSFVKYPARIRSTVIGPLPGAPATQVGTTEDGAL